MKNEFNYTQLISTWEDFGYRFRGDWQGNKAYAVKDVVKHIVKEKETYFICESAHVSVHTPNDSKEWSRY